MSGRHTRLGGRGGALARVVTGGGWWLLNDRDLSPFQQLGAAWIVGTCRRYGGALLYDAPGLGKTRTALAAARALGGAVEVIAPAVLVPRWRAELARCGMDGVVVSDGLLSSGGAPACDASVVLVDEAHRFGSVGTRRSEALASRVVGRWAVLLTATPARNGWDELASLVDLLVAPERLVGPAEGGSWKREEGEGMLSFVGLGRSRSSAVAFDASVGGGGCVLPRIPAVSGATLAGLCWSEELLDELGGLAERLVPLSGEPQALYRLLVFRALASSPQAAAETLERGCAFARRWREAAQAGRTLSRQEFRVLLGEGGEQQVFPFWYREGEATRGFDARVMQDAQRMAAVLRAVPCAAAGVLESIASLGCAAVLFSERRATVDAYAAALRTRRLVVRVGGGSGWAPGLGRCEVGEALRWFEGAARRDRKPLLVCTPVLSEGLDLQCASALIHLDLAWNPARMAQREGRVVRPGGGSEALVLRVGVDRQLEARCGAEATLERKGELPGSGPEASVASLVLSRGGAFIGRRSGGRFAWYEAAGRRSGWVFVFRGGAIRCVGVDGSSLLGVLERARRRRRSGYWLRLRLARPRGVVGEGGAAGAAALEAIRGLADRLAVAGRGAEAGVLVRSAHAAVLGTVSRGARRHRAVRCGGALPDAGSGLAAWSTWVSSLAPSSRTPSPRCVVVVRIRRCFT